MTTALRLFPALTAWGVCLGSAAVADPIVYAQPAGASGTLLRSSWWDPDGSDYDQYVWDSFTLSSAAALTGLEWRGGFDPSYFGSGGAVLDFTIAIYPSIAAGTEPNIVNPPLVRYHTYSNAGQTFAGVFGGVSLFDYAFTLPVAFQAAAGVKYWVQIEAFQHGVPDWGLASGTGGNGGHFRRIAGMADAYYQLAPGDSAFTLHGIPEPASVGLLTVGAALLAGSRRGRSKRRTAREQEAAAGEPRSSGELREVSVLKSSRSGAGAT